MKRFGGQAVVPGNIIIRQRGTKFYPGVGVMMGKDHTIFAVVEGQVSFTTSRNREADQRWHRGPASTLAPSHSLLKREPRGSLLIFGPLKHFMQFIDLWGSDHARSLSNGGDGIIAWRREKYVPKGVPRRPAMADAVATSFSEATLNVGTLVDFRFKKVFRADSGNAGSQNNKS